LKLPQSGVTNDYIKLQTETLAIVQQTVERDWKNCLSVLPKGRAFTVQPLSTPNNNILTTKICIKRPRNPVAAFRKEREALSLLPTRLMKKQWFHFNLARITSK
jgi:hypothetical protein